MAVGSWWVVNDTLLKIVAGPFLWDGSAMGLIAPLRAVNTDPMLGGYTPMLTDLPSQLWWLNARLAAVENRLAAEARGVAQTPAIALGATVTVQVPLKTPMPSLTYTPTAFLIGNAVLNNLTIQTTAVGTNQRVDVGVKSSLGVTLGAASVLVFADA